jgi:hypothetical protein
LLQRQIDGGCVTSSNETHQQLFNLFFATSAFLKTQTFEFLPAPTLPGPPILGNTHRSAILITVVFEEAHNYLVALQEDEVFLKLIDVTFVVKTKAVKAPSTTRIQ